MNDDLHAQVKNFTFTSESVNNLLEKNNLSSKFFSEEFLTKDIINKKIREILSYSKSNELRELLINGLEFYDDIAKLKEMYIRVLADSEHFLKNRKIHHIIIKIQEAIEEKNYPKAIQRINRLIQNFQNSVFLNIQRKMKNFGMEKLTLLLSQPKCNIVNKLELLIGDLETKRDSNEILVKFEKIVLSIILITLISEALNKHENRDIIKGICALLLLCELCHKSNG